MGEMTIEILKRLLENVPEGYNLGYTVNGTEVKVSKIEIDIENEVVIFK